MRKRLLLLLAAIVTLWSICCGCADNTLLKQGIRADQLQLTFDLPAEIQVNGEVYQCQLFHDVTQSTVITLTENG